ncbi:type II secretion system minor pseudopilin GspK [Acinetobacter baumannii]|uniref:type II secretion system minor pseudopilin GspK n=1 Tax=Acinetobacter baumannii TaxID=470 RepID=UPI00387A19ED
MAVSYKHQQGVALLTILIMVALATILAASIAKHQNNTMENTAYLMRQNQSLLYAKSAEAFFSELLIQDANNAGGVDHLKETWAQPMPPFSIEEGSVSGRLLDESGKFNLNNLSNGEGIVNEDAKSWFERLLVRVGLPAELSQAVIDWQDPNDEPTGPMGAESSYYEGLDPGYMAANTKFHRIEELKLVRGFDGKKFDLIAPYISALPENSKLNINTASPLVLASMDEKLDIGAIERELQTRQQNLKFFQNVDELWQLNAFSAVDSQKKNQVNSLIDVKSSFFQAQIEVVLNNRKRQFTSALMRKDKQAYVYSRSMAPFN